MEVLDCSIYLMESPGFFYVFSFFPSAVRTTGAPCFNLYDSFLLVERKKSFFSYLNCQNKEKSSGGTSANPFPPTTARMLRNVRTIKWKFLANYLSAPRRLFYYLWRNYTTSKRFPLISSSRLNLVSFLLCEKVFLAIWRAGKKWNIIYGRYHYQKWYITA